MVEPAEAERAMDHADFRTDDLAVGSFDQIFELALMILFSDLGSANLDVNT